MGAANTASRVAMHVTAAYLVTERIESLLGMGSPALNSFGMSRYESDHSLAHCIKPASCVPPLCRCPAMGSLRQRLLPCPALKEMTLRGWTRSLERDGKV